MYAIKIAASIGLALIWATDPDHAEGRPARRLLEMVSGALVILLLWVY